MIYLYGAGGHGKVILEILEVSHLNIGGFFDDREFKSFQNYPVNHFPDKFDFLQDQIIISIGNNQTRKKIAESIKVDYAQAIHPGALVSSSSIIGWGTVIMAGVVINAGAQIGNQVIVNSLANVDHDCQIGDYVHIAPGAILCGGVRIGEGTIVGAGATVTPHLTIGKNVIIGAGSVIISDVPDSVTVVGNPAKIIK